MLERIHAQSLSGHSRALPRSMPQAFRAAEMAGGQLGSTRALLNTAVHRFYGVGAPQDKV